MPEPFCELPVEVTTSTFEKRRSTRIVRASIMGVLEPLTDNSCKVFAGGEELRVLLSADTVVRLMNGVINRASDPEFKYPYVEAKAATGCS